MIDRLRSTAVTKRSLTVAGHRTSVSLEDAFWEGLRQIAGRRDVPPSTLVAEIDRGRDAANLSSAIRVFVLTHLHHGPESPAAASALHDAPGSLTGPGP